MSIIDGNPNEKVGVAAFRANLGNYVRRAKAGETVAITRRGHEIARLVPLSSDKETET